MSNSREKIGLILTLIVGGFTMMIFYNDVIEFFFNLLGIYVSDPWVAGIIAFSIGALLLILSTKAIALRFRCVQVNGRYDMFSILVFFVGGGFATFSLSLLLSGILVVILQAFGEFLQVPVL